MKHLLTITVFTILLIPALAFATGTPDAGIVPCDGPDCQTCDVVELAQNLLTWFISVMAAVIALIFAIGGLKMVVAGGDESQVTSARSMMTNAVIGFVILLSAWLIVDTIMKTFVRGADSGSGEEKYLLGPWNEIKCVGQPDRESVDTTPPERDEWDPSDPVDPPHWLNPDDSGGSGGGGGPITEPNPVVTLTEKKIFTWSGISQGAEFPTSSGGWRWLSIPRKGYTAIRFNTGSVRHSGGIVSVSGPPTNAVPLASLSKVSGNFNVNPECRHETGNQGGIGWTTENKTGYCQLESNTTYYINWTFTDGVIAGSDRCLPTDTCSIRIDLIPDYSDY